MIKQIGSFIARDSTGKTYRINKFTDFTKDESPSGRIVLPGFSSLKTENGIHVERVAKGRYKIYGTPPISHDVELTSDDAEAP
ncbi:MAG: hypothetical protein R6V76_06760 [Desulfobacterales bacterium]